MYLTYTGNFSKNFPYYNIHNPYIHILDNTLLVIYLYIIYREEKKTVLNYRYSMLKITNKSLLNRVLIYSSDKKMSSVLNLL